MNCHDDSKGKESTHNHSSLKHMLHMVLCCGLPIVIIGLLPFIARVSPSTAGVLGKIAPFLCPLMMIGMIPMMLRGNKKGSCCDNTNDKDKNKSLELKKSIE